MLKRISLILSVLTLVSCASVQKDGSVYDPFEPTNRVVFDFNTSLDNNVMQPIARVYTLLPSVMRVGVSNFMGNLADVVTLINELLQFKLKDAVSDFMRIVTNTTLGIGGLLDIATKFDLNKHNETFADTLGVWGVGSGAYVVLPVFGPSSVRDGPAKIADSYANPMSYLDPVAHRNSLTALGVVNSRANLLKASRMSDELALDAYAFMRDSYLQWRQYQVYDGDPPQKFIDDIYIEDLE